MPSVRPVVVHGDWRIENVCIQANQLVGVYDWDSVHVAPETAALAAAATTFSVDWRRPAGKRFPSSPEIGAFVSDYEAVRGSLTSAERDILATTIVVSLAYGARCEHADASQPSSFDDSQRGLLRALGSALLVRGLASLDD